MIISDKPLLDSAADLDRLSALGWSEDALRVRPAVLEILQGWRASPQIEWEKLPSPAELEPLVVVWKAGAPATADAALLLALLATARRVAGRRSEKKAAPAGTILALKVSGNPVSSGRSLQLRPISTG